MPARREIGHAEARALIAMVADRLEADGAGAAIAVVDPHGELVAFLRTDGCGLASIQIAMNKAFTAAGHRKRTDNYKNSLPGEEAFGIWTQHGGRFTVFVGGFPIVVDGQVVGGIGASGGNGEQDIACCEAGIAAFMATLKK